MKKKFLLTCLMVTLAACEKGAEKNTESSLVGTTWTREFTASHWLEGAHTSIYYTVHDYVVFTSETEMLRDLDGYDGYSEHYRYTLDGTDLTLEYVKGKTSSGSFSRGTYVGESLILYNDDTPYVFEKSHIK